MINALNTHKMPIRNHFISPGAGAVAAFTLSDTETHSTSTITASGITDIRISDPALPTAFTTVSYATITVVAGSETSVFTKTATTGAGTGTGSLFTGANRAQVARIVSPVFVGFIVSYTDATARNTALANLNLGTATVTVANAETAATPPTVGSETTLDAGEGGHVEQILVETTGVEATNAQKNLLTYTITDGQGAGGIASDATRNVTMEIRRGSAIPGNAIVSNINAIGFHLVINS